MIELPDPTPLAEQFRTAEPFPHVVVDDFLPAGMATAAAGAFPPVDGFEWDRVIDFANATGKWTHRTMATMPGPIRDVLTALNGAEVVDWLETVTGIDGVIPDPHLEGGGIHRIATGGFLNIHADFNRHERLRLDRRLNLLVYLNPQWDEAWGGHLELWDAKMTRAVRRVAPIFNRAVLFATTDRSFHGHPDPLRSPPGVYRSSVATYYYSNGRPIGEQSEGHSTLYQRRPGDPVEQDSVVRRGRRLARRLVRR